MEEKEMKEQLKKEIEAKICNVLDAGIQNNNIDVLGKLVDIHKDLANEKYWEDKEEMYDEKIRKLSWWLWK